MVSPILSFYCDTGHDLTLYKNDGGEYVLDRDKVTIATFANFTDANTVFMWHVRSLGEAVWKRENGE